MTPGAFIANAGAEINDLRVRLGKVEAASAAYQAQAEALREENERLRTALSEVMRKFGAATFAGIPCYEANIGTADYERWLKLAESEGSDD